MQALPALMGNSVGMAADPTAEKPGTVDRTRTRRHLPHWEEPGTTYFITFCLARGVRADLTRLEVAQILSGALHYFAGERYDLYDHTIMPDHVHAIIKPMRRTDGSWEPLSRILHSIKSWTANRVNEALGRRGALWQDETYDHVIRDEKDYDTKSEYIWLNPVVAGLVQRPEDWPWWGNG